MQKSTISSFFLASRGGGQYPARVGFGQSRSESEEKTPFTLVEKCKLKKSFQATNMVMITFSLVLRKRVGRPSRVR